MNKRLIKEITNIQTDIRKRGDIGYVISVPDDDICKVKVLIKGVYDSVYRHKFIRLDIVIGDQYPFTPPEVYFINYDGVRIHPNMYENGKCCLTILNTWGDNIFEKWTSSMGIETIILAFQSFLDNNPYTYEPGGRDDETYTVFVKYQSWKTCLIRYLENETEEIFLEYMYKYILNNYKEIEETLNNLIREYPYGSYYTKCFEIYYFMINYTNIKKILEDFYSYLSKDIDMCCLNDPDTEKEYIYEEEQHKGVCEICFENSIKNDFKIALRCDHIFHYNCLMKHIEINASLCPMCRDEIIIPEWIVNPSTNRRIKFGGKTHKNKRGILKIN